MIIPKDATPMRVEQDGVLWTPEAGKDSPARPGSAFRRVPPSPLTPLTQIRGRPPRPLASARPRIAGAGRHRLARAVHAVLAQADELAGRRARASPTVGDRPRRRRGGGDAGRAVAAGRLDRIGRGRARGADARVYLIVWFCGPVAAMASRSRVSSPRG